MYAQREVEYEAKKDKRIMASAYHEVYDRTIGYLCIEKNDHLYIEDVYDHPIFSNNENDNTLVIYLIIPPHSAWDYLRMLIKDFRWRLWYLPITLVHGPTDRARSRFIEALRAGKITASESAHECPEWNAIEEDTKTFVDTGMLSGRLAPLVSIMDYI